MEFRPCIDIHNGSVKQIVGGSLKDKADYATENFVSQQDAAFYARLYKDSGIKGGHIILLNPSTSEFYEKTKAQAISALGTYRNGLQVGGGITPDNAQEFIDAGAQAVIVTSYVFKDGKINYDNLKKIYNAVGREHLVLDLSCQRKVERWLVWHWSATKRIRFILWKRCWKESFVYVFINASKERKPALHMPPSRKATHWSFV